MLAGRVDHVEGRLGRDVAVDGGDTAACDRDVEAALVAAARIDDVAAPDQQVEPHASSPSAIDAVARGSRSSASRRTNP